MARTQQGTNGWSQAHRAVAPLRVPRVVAPRRRLPLYAAAAAGAATFLLLTDFGRDTRGPLPLAHHVDDLAVAAGFGLDAVSLSGHRFTPSSDLFAAIDLDASRVTWAADVAAIRQRIERMPWIASANVARAGFNGLQVTVTERRPAAVWKSGGGGNVSHQLVDERGRILGPVGASALTDLLQISGDGGADALPSLLALLDTDPVVKRQVVHAEFVSARRWSLTLNTGLVLHLPYERELDALKLASGLAAELANTGSSLGRLVGGQEIDVSVPGRIAVRHVVPAAGAAKPAGLSSNGS